MLKFPSFISCHFAQHLLRFGRTMMTLGIMLAFAPVVHAQTQTWGLANLYIFQGSISGPDGGTPTGGLIIGSDGNYYGTTLYGGTGGGVVFKVTPAGTETIVYAFSGSQDAQLPSKLVEGTHGNFYGTAYWGGGTNGYGIIYKVTPSGKENILQSFSNTNGGPANPGAGLTLGADGNFYGTSTAGGTTGQGTFFKMTPAGKLTVLYSFDGASGGSPAAELIQVDDGEFFGTTRQGGDGGYGTVFKVRDDGVLKVLHSFTGGSDGAYPAAPLIHGQDGAFYSTTEAGGTGDCAFPGLPTGCGTVYRVTAAGEESVIHEFAGYPTDGSSPVGGLVQDQNGTFYGTTGAGGFTDPGNCSAGCGTIFSMTPTGTEQILYACGEPPDPWYYDCWAPSGTLLLSVGDTLTGTSQNGGGGWGNVFSIAPAPTVTLSAAPTTIALHNSTALTWTSTHAQSCEASGAWNGTEAIEGRESVVPAGTGPLIYTLTCTGIGGTAGASAMVTVTQ
jgi:uncharacterized repeat protein (TIGR03803 family)